MKITRVPKKGASKRKRKILTIEEKKKREAELKVRKEQKKYIAQIRGVFSNVGFKRIASDGKEINFKGRTGEIDDIFLYENILVVCEQTSGKKSGHHLMNKNYLYNEIINHKVEFVEFVNNTFDEFTSQKNSNYTYDQYNVIVLYCSRYGVPTEHKELLSKKIKFLDYPVLHYFLALTSTIKLSSKYEILNFLGLRFEDVGENAINTSTGSGSRYNGTILPESHSSFDRGYKVVTFYIDPEALISRAYVLRKDGWIDGGILYQRALIRNKVAAMRSYLKDEKRVFVNNVIATLSEDTRFLDSNNNTLDINGLSKTSPVSISLPNDFNSICIIDGQHRLYAYHERHDLLEAEISTLRKRQNLLVTAIYYPKGTSSKERTKFEAKLFLEINDKQSKAKADLKQAIELILKPYSATAISKDLLTKLARKGPLENFIEVYAFDKDKLKTASIVTYGLKPLVKLGGVDSLYSIWTDPNKDSLLTESNDDALVRYKAFCESEINSFLIGFKRSIDKERWTTNENGVIRVTIINGLIVALRNIIENKKTGDLEHYMLKMEGIDSFPFKDYKSSQWGALGKTLYEKFFA